MSIEKDIWDELVEKYDISGYTDKIIFVKLDTLIELHEKADKLEAIKKKLDFLKEEYDKKTKSNDREDTGYTASQIEKILKILEG